MEKIGYKRYGTFNRKETYEASHPSLITYFKRIIKTRIR
jgi:hypothetical protein